jgi:hypothetical protein
MTLRTATSAPTWADTGFSTIHNPYYPYHQIYETTGAMMGTEEPVT